ncbi:MAG: tetratricopeptide repeat protein [Candidatus Heimdallarchaeota archaeon]|nr:tetratricopeptide repeat protein [Candidatus Heimdallarchaeota archaeon]
MVRLEKAELIHIQNLIIRGEYNDAYQLLGSVKELDSGLTDEEYIHWQILYSIVSIKLGTFKRSLRSTKSVYKKARKEKNSLLALEALTLIALALDYLGNLEEEKSWIKKGDKLYKKMVKKKGLEYKTILAKFLSVKGRYSYSLGEFQEAETSLQQALALIQDSNEEPLKAEILETIAHFHFLQGKIKSSLEYYQKCLDIWEAIENKQTIAIIRNDLAQILALQGDIHLALENYFQGLEVVEKGENDFVIGTFQQNIGLVYLEMENFKQSIEWLLESLTSFEEIGNSRKISQVLFNLSLVQIRNRTFQEAEKYIDKLLSMKNKTEDLLISQRYLLGKALLLLKTSSRFLDKGKAEEILIEILEDKEFDHRITVTSLFNLCKLHLTNLKNDENQELLQKLEANLERLEEIAVAQDSYIRLIETYLLQAQLSVIKQDAQKAQELLQQALSLAKLKELDRLVEKTSNIQNLLQVKLELWEKLYHYNASLADLLELTPYEEGLKHFSRTKIKKVSLDQNEDPILLIILDPSGTSMFSKKFLPDSQFDEQLISGFLFAINNFMQETFAGKGTIDRITYLDYTLLFKSLEPFLICYAYQGQSYSAQQSLDLFSNNLESSQDIWEALISYTETGFVPDIENLLLLENLVDNIFNPELESMSPSLEDDLTQEDLSDLLDSKL